MNKVDTKTAEGILFTDQYQLTMAQLYYRMGLHEKPAQFDYFFRHYPDYGAHKAGYCINAGLEWLINWMRSVRFRKEDIEYLRGQTRRSGEPVFDQDFLTWLEETGHYGDITMNAIPEGRVVHPNVPLAVFQGPLAMAQILETSVLNHLNYQTLIATKAARIRESGRGQLFLEFGARRGHDKGVNAGARAALIGGADFTSNVGISHVLGLPPKGTHAHSMVQAFLALGMSELDAFKAYADVYPDECLLLVDTIDTLKSGIPNAIEVFEDLKKKGYKPVGIRLDSGDLAYLSIQAAKMLNAAGFPDTSIVLSNELDELNIWQIITQIEEEGPRNGLDPDKLIRRLAYGVGTRLITSAGDSSLGGVYKLVALWGDNTWIPAIKISESTSKTPNPGNKKVWRVYDKRKKATADLLSAEDEDPRKFEKLVLHHPSDRSIFRALDQEMVTFLEPLMVDVLKEGKVVYNFPSLEEIREIRDSDIESLDSGVKRVMNPHVYHVSITERLWQLKQELIESVREQGH
ncbi:nicotinate phosphoribosyltransferase [candidate division KSB1 bacterium]|nr:nicotinate phosphoribosyltransferase [candidate division KSB1 bacterium]NIR68501.1 nicotinate phosphoribosyltransferase [candidate division KSB1 bacterium]NIS22515.1 nicotinate phosphoribosyltransferase [candidate division KSB1 bacterium]NIT69359.1 nicotinate phosphoribosyltransferase [candidate division KSB1 bacterium]NIU23020.1 nicotinate phosphoribosyltransferase [candidate division KSB1 bacterium]